MTKIEFLMKNFKALMQIKIKKLSTAAQDLFHFIESFGRFNNINDTLSICLLEDPIQTIDTYTYGQFQLFFFENLINASEKSKI